MCRIMCALEQGAARVMVAAHPYLFYSIAHENYLDTHGRRIELHE